MIKPSYHGTPPFHYYFLYCFVFRVVIIRLLRLFGQCVTFQFRKTLRISVSVLEDSMRSSCFQTHHYCYHYYYNYYQLLLSPLLLFSLHLPSPFTCSVTTTATTITAASSLYSPLTTNTTTMMHQQTTITASTNTTTTSSSLLTHQ